MNKDYPDSVGSFSGPFFGFPLTVTVERKNPQCCNYAFVKFYFPDGYSPNGCQIYKIAENIKRIFRTKTEILPEDGINKIIFFKKVTPYIRDGGTAMASMFFSMVREEGLFN